MTPKFCRSNPSWRLPAVLVTLGLALGLPALAGDEPAAPESGANEPVAVKVGNATVRWHLDAAPEAAKSPLIERYRQLVAARFTGDEVPAAEKAAIEAPAGEARTDNGFASRGTVRVPAEQFHTLFVDADGAAVCAKAGASAKSAAIAGEGEDR